MAEASCSGGTPFKRLIDHQSRDASNHQDRLVEGPRPGGFASFRSPLRTHSQAPQGFDAFLNENPTASSAFPAFPNPASRLAVHAAALQLPPAAPEFSHARTTPAPDVSGWAADFSRFSNQQHIPPVAATSAMHLSQQQQHSSSVLDFRSAFGRPGPAFAPMLDRGNMARDMPLEPGFDQEMARWMASHGGGNMSDVDAAMDQMARELELNEAALPETSTAPVALESQETASAMRLTDLETPEIGKLSLHEPTANHPASLQAEQGLVTPQLQQQLSDDAAGLDKLAVSEAAERLLESVQHEDGEKWQNSVFLSLMRDFRDGRKDIVENEIRQTMASPGAEDTAEQSLP